MSDSGDNLFAVLTAQPLSTDEVVLTGTVKAGTIRRGAWATFDGGSDLPMTAQIIRIGTEDTPLNLVREGTQTTLVLGAEPQHLNAGMTLSISEEGTFAPTMLLTELAPAQRGSLELPPQDLIDIERIVSERKFPEALEKLEARPADAYTTRVAKRLQARIHLESDGEERDPAKALALIKEAYTGEGKGDADVLETLARALGDAGDPAAGVRYLDRLYTYALDAESRDYYMKRIENHRKRYKLPDKWDVLDPLGDPIFSASDPMDIVKGFEAKRFPDKSQVRKNRIGRLEDMDKFVKSVAKGGVSTKPGVTVGAGGGSSDGPNVVLIGAAAGGGLLVGAVIGQVAGMNALVLGAVGAVAGAVVGFVLSSKSK